MRPTAWLYVVVPASTLGSNNRVSPSLPVSIGFSYESVCSSQICLLYSPWICLL